MAIQVRRGLKKDFDPSKMLPGEWAVSIDSVSSNQIVWMCFAAGVCKRMGTYEDFYAQITEATKDIRDSYVSDFDEIKADIELIADVVSSNKEEVLIIKSDIVNTYLPQIRQYVSDAQMAASTATSKANSASDSALLAESYTHGGTGTRENENADNAKYYYEQTKQISQGLNGIVPMGTVAFADLPTTDIVDNAMYNVSDAFTSDERFNDGGGIYYGPGNNVIWTAEGKWDVTASSSVTGIKGEAEEEYRVGNVNITKSNIGLSNVDNTSDADKPISDATQAALGEVNERIDESVLDLKAQIDATNSNFPVVLTNGSIDFAKYKNIVITFFDNSINSSAFSVSIDPNISRYHTISENFFANSSVYCFTCKLKMENKTITVQDAYYYDLVNNTIREVTNLPTIHKIVGYK